MPPSKGTRLCTSSTANRLLNKPQCQKKMSQRQKSSKRLPEEPRKCRSPSRTSVRKTAIQKQQPRIKPVDMRGKSQHGFMSTWDQRVKNPLGFLLSSQERLDFRDLSTGVFSSDSSRNSASLGSRDGSLRGLIMNLKMENKEQEETNSDEKARVSFSTETQERGR